MSQGSSSVEPFSNLTLRQRKIQMALGDYLLPKVGQNAPAYGKSTVAPLDKGYDTVRSMINSFDPNRFSAAQTDALNSALSGKPSYNVDNATTQKYFQDSVAAPALRNFNQNIAPQIKAAFAGTGGSFSTRAGLAQTRALSNMNGDFASQLAAAMQSNQTLQAQLHETAANRQANAITLAEQLKLAPVTSASALSAALAPFQNNSQAQTGDAYNQWQMQQGYNSPWNSLAMQFLGGNFSTAANFQHPADGGINAGVGALGGAASGALSGAMVGNVVPGLGTGIGALIGGLVGGVGGGAAGYGGSPGGGVSGGFGSGAGAATNYGMLMRGAGGGLPAQTYASGYFG